MNTTYALAAVCRCVWLLCLCALVCCLLFGVALCALVAGAGWRETCEHAHEEFQRFLGETK